MLLHTVQSPGSRNKIALASISPLSSILFQYSADNIKYSWRCFMVSVPGLFSKCSSTDIYSSERNPLKSTGTRREGSPSGGHRESLCMFFENLHDMTSGCETRMLQGRMLRLWQ